MQCTRPIFLRDYEIHVPCGKCAHCRRQRAIEWKTRLLHEADYHEDSVFLTLTYDDEFLPETGDVDKGEWQRFMKRLRKSLGDRRVKYYACGEYGEENLRPHYHAIVFGLSPCGMCWSCLGPGVGADTPKGDCERVRDAWPFGFVRIGSVTGASVGYVAGYIEKALFTPELKAHERPFSLMSRGLGERFVVDNADQVRAKLGVTVFGKEVGLPRYYRRKLDISTEELAEKAKERQAELEEHYYGRYGLSDDAYEAVKAHRVQSEKNIRAQGAMRRRNVES